MQASAPTQGAGGGREDAAARKDICRVRCGTPPSPAATPPLAGEASGAATHKKAPPARGAGCAGRRRLRGALPAGGGNTQQGLTGPCPAVHGDAARPRGGRDCPPYIAAENGRQPVSGSRLQRPTTGRCKHRPLRRGVRRPGGCGSPEGSCPRVSQGVWRPGRVFARPGAAPLRRLRRHLPLQGGFRGGSRTERLPCKGSWMRRKAQTEGCIAALWRKYPLKPGSALPRVSQGVRRPGGRGGPEGYLQDQVRHPSVACGDTSPYRRGFRGRQRTKRRPCKGSLSSSSLLKAASPVKGRRWRRLPYPSTVTSVRRTWPASQASRSRMQGAGRLPAVRSTRP